MDESQQAQLDLEIELIESSLLPSETLNVDPHDAREINISSTASKLALHVTLGESYPVEGSLRIEVKGPEIGREEAEGWRAWVQEKMEDWNENDDCPLFQILTTHFLPLLAPSSPSRSPSPPPPTESRTDDDQPHHALLTSHHLLSTTKRKDFLALSSSLSLVGFSKTGHPGIYYAIGTKDDLAEWIREVKSWNWLALKVRISPEPLDGEQVGVGRGGEDGARGGKGRGDWIELEKINEALEWLKKRGREGLLLDLGMGGGTGATDK